ncbi:MAG: helix-hairpin-helix domain-containing protein, partial [Eubacterium sp.]
MEEKQGIITDIIFHNEENGYTIAVMETSDEQFTAVGMLPENALGNTFLLRGAFKIHPKYGEQFAFTEAEAVLPSSADEIEGFLASGAVKGIGQKMAHAIVQTFGDDTLNVMKEHPSRLLRISGIGKKSLAKITESFNEQWSFAEVSMFFQKYRIPQASAFRLFKAYGADTVARITENPYRLADEVRGIGFRKADQIALKLNLPPDSDMRIESGVKYTLGYYAGDGSTYVPKEKLCEETAQLLDLTRSQIDDVLLQMSVDGSVMQDHINGEDVVYLYAYYEAEKKTAGNIARLVSADLKELQADIRSSIDMTEAHTGIQLSEEQKGAVEASLTSGVSVITGGPGTGKTTIIHALLDIFEGSGFKTLLAAPTGRAAKRITETSGRQASTIHRMLEYARGEEESMAFGKNEDEPLQ